MLRPYKQSVFPILSGILLGLLSTSFYLSENPIIQSLLQRLEAIPYDIRLKLSTPELLSNLPPIVIVDIDEASLKREGRWPWSRTKLAKLIDRLDDSGVAVTVLDILQAEPESNPLTTVKYMAKLQGLELPDSFNRLQTTLNADLSFSQSISDKEVVLGYTFHTQTDSTSGQLHQPNVFLAKETNPEQLTLIKMKGYSANLKQFTEKSSSSGFFSITPDGDGVVRHAVLIALYKNKIYPSLALEAARLYLLEDQIKVHSKPIGKVHTITHISLGKANIPTDAMGRLLIPYRGKEKHFSYFSATDILNKPDKIPQLENAIVLIGTSAKGLVDSRTTPLQPSFPGVEIQANILHALLHPETISYLPDWEAGAIVSLIALLSVLMILLYPLLQPFLLVVTGSSLFFLVFLFNYALWKGAHIYLPVIIPLLLVMAVSSIFVIHHLLRENRDRRRIHTMFGQYVPLEHINKMIESPQKISTQGEKREMSVLFSDIRNFTELSEPLSTRQLKNFLNAYLTPITEIVFQQQGTIDKYVGDMVMAFWGAPLENPMHARDAVKAALLMQNKIKEMQTTFAQMGLSQVNAGIGIHSGEMNVGDMGSEFRRAYTVLGDSVNLASRLEGLTKYYGVKILVSEKTKKECLSKTTPQQENDEILFRYIDHIRAKGKQSAIKIYEPLGIKNTLNQNVLEHHNLHEKAMEMYQTQQWNSASVLLNELLDIYHEPLYQLYLDRLNALTSQDTTDWDGIFTHTNK